MRLETDQTDPFTTVQYCLPPGPGDGSHVHLSVCEMKPPTVPLYGSASSGLNTYVHVPSSSCR